MNVAKLRGKIVEKGLNIEKTANIVGINRTSMYRKMNKPDSFTIGDARKMKDALELTDDEAREIFLS